MLRKCKNEREIRSLIDSYFKKTPDNYDSLKKNEPKQFLSKKFADLIEISSRFLKKGGEKIINFTKFFGFKPETEELKSKKQLLNNFFNGFEELLRLLDQTIKLELDLIIRLYKECGEKIEFLSQISDIRDIFFNYHELIEQKEVVEKYSEFFVIPKTNSKNNDSTIFSEIAIEHITERKQFLAGGFANINKIKGSIMNLLIFALIFSDYILQKKKLIILIFISCQKQGKNFD